MSTSDSIQYYPLGDSAIVINFGDAISENINTLIQKVTSSLDTLKAPQIIEYVPAFTTITIYYNPVVTTYDEIVHAVHQLLRNLPEDQEKTSTTKEIPVWYNGPDLEYVASHTGLSQEEVIRIHSEQIYLVYMIGFAPGFPYLGGMDKRLATPRKEIPRIKIEAGAVGIAGEQTGVYPMETPGGWQIIGQTPLNLFDFRRDTPALLKSGDQIYFVPVEVDEFLEIKEKEYGD